MFMSIVFDSRMTDDSKFVIRWDIEDAAAKYASGKVESEEFDQGGFRWTAAVERSRDRARFTLRCGVDHNGPWKCDAIVRLSEGSYAYFDRPLCFDEKTCGWNYTTARSWIDVISERFHVQGKATFEFLIRIISSDRGRPIVDPTFFAVPNNRSDVILVIGEKKLHVSKELLAIHSPVFEALFFGDFAEKGKEEVELKDVIYEEFIDLLNLIYHRTFEISDHTVSHILKLADRFQIESVVEQSTKHLTRSNGIDVVKKLLLSDQYNIQALKEQCLQSFTSANDLTVKMKTSKEFVEMSADMKVAIFDRVLALTPSP